MKYICKNDNSYGIDVNFMAICPIILATFIVWNIYVKMTIILG